MKRRDLLLGTVASLTIAAGASSQGGSTLRRIGIIMPYPATDAEVQARVAAFREELARFGWRVGQNVQLEERWATDDMGSIRLAAAELVASNPDVILSTGSRVIPVLKQQTQTIPIVFAATSDPVGRGLVASLARPSGNVTGFALADGVLVDKLLEVLKQVAPSVRRVAIIFNPDNPASPLNIEAFHRAASALGLERVIAPAPDPDKVVSLIEEHSREPNTGLVFPSDLSMLARREAIVAAAARYNIPAVYADGAMVAGGGLISYSPDRKHQFKRAAEYVDRILRGAKPADLPVQQPQNFELAVNLRAATALGLTVGPDLLARADLIIE